MEVDYTIIRSNREGSILGTILTPLPAVLLVYRGDECLILTCSADIDERFCWDVYR